MFAYCGNNPINACDISGYRDEDENGTWSLKHDTPGVIILLYWLYGNGEDRTFVEGSWGAYLRTNTILSGYVNSTVFGLVGDLEPGQIISVDITTSAEIENGESIIGYQYLHGTNADAGGFKIVGTVGRDEYGNALYDLEFTWNDYIDPNYIYSSDKMKAKFARLIPFAHPKDYKISITWRMKNPNYRCGGGRIKAHSIAVAY